MWRIARALLAMTAVHDYHELHARRLVREPRRFRVLRTFDGPATGLGARARDVIRAEFGEPDAPR